MNIADERPTSPAASTEDVAFLVHVIDTQNELAAVETNYSAVMQIIVDRARLMLSGSGATLEFVDGSEVICRAASGDLQTFIGQRLPIANSVSGACVLSADVVLCRDISIDPRVNHAIARQFDCRSVVSAPLMHQGAVVGVLKVTSNELDAFGDRAVWALRLMARFMGAALTHAKDFEVKQRLLTERAAAIAALQESEERFRKSYEDAPIGMALVALDGRWIKVNRAMCDIVGYTSAELLATDFQSVTHADDLDADLELLEQLTAGKIRTYQMVKRYIHRSGRHVWIQLNVSLVRDAAGKPLYFVSQIQDINERKRMEDALRDSERAYRTMFDLAGAGMANVDLHTGRFQNVNQRLCELLGYSPDELSELTVHDVTHPDDRTASIDRGPHDDGDGFASVRVSKAVRSKRRHHDLGHH